MDESGYYARNPSYLQVVYSSILYCGSQKKKMKSILILAFSDLNHDARVNRQIDFLKDNYNVSIASFGNTPTENTKTYALKRVRPTLIDKLLGGVSLILRWYNLAYKIIYNQEAYLNVLKGVQYDLIISNDIETLPLAFKLSQQSKILFDAHEYAPRHFEDKLLWRIFFSGFNNFLCKTYLPKVDAMLTVGKGLAEEYQKHFNVDPIILTNANYFEDLNPKPTDPQYIKLVHHGAANPSRQLELMIEAMHYLDDRFSLDMVLLTPTIANKKTRNYLDELKKLVDRNPKVNIIPPVKSNEVIQLIHRYDVGVFLIPPINFNYKNTLPNKLFDFVQARLAIVVGPTPEMASLVREYDLGVASSAFTAKSFAEALMELTPKKIDYFKNNSNLAAARLSAENNKLILNKVVEGLISK